MLFYSAMAVVIATKRHRLIVVGFVAALVGGLIWPTPLLRFVGNPIILEFLMGVALFRLQQVPAIGTAAIFVALMLFAASPATGADNNLLARKDAQIVFGKWDGFIRLGFWGLPAALLVYGAVSNEQWFRRSSWKPMVWLGGASYSIYLLHWWPTHSGLGPWPILVGMSLLAGGMFHLAIERPLLSFKLAPFKHRRLPSGDPDQLHDQAVYESQ